MYRFNWKFCWTYHVTRKSSCVNARGIPTAAYQVLHLFPEVGYPPAGVPPWPGLTGGLPKVGYPPPARVPPSQVWWGGGYSRWVTPGRGYLPPPHVWTDRLMDGQTRVKTLPSCRTTYAVSKNCPGDTEKTVNKFLPPTSEGWGR